MIPRCDRCDRQVFYQGVGHTGPDTYEHFRNDTGTYDFILCRTCMKAMRLFLQYSPVQGERL